VSATGHSDVRRLDDFYEYAWLVWGPNRGGPVGQIRVLAETPKGER
jgi:hypothetical protein